MELKETSGRGGARAGAGFNRTFMELKVHGKIRWFPWASFQSHLYGIESQDNRCHGRCVALKFQSHLYGIERPGACEICLRHIVSIAPLWN